MDQEISAQAQTAREVITLFLNGSDAARALGDRAFDPAIVPHIDALRDQYDDARIRDRFYELCDLPSFRALLANVPRVVAENATLGSAEAGFFADLLPIARSEDDRRAVRFLDA